MLDMVDAVKEVVSIPILVGSRMDVPDLAEEEIANGRMEAARTCALRGHKVTLFEKSDKLGGNLIFAGKHAFKKEVARLNAWYQSELKEFPIDIHMGEETTPESIRALGSDVVILAMVSNTIIPRIKGIELEKCMSCSEALTDKKPVGDNVIIVGGGLVGCEMALEYLQEGKKVTIVEALDHILSAGAPVPWQNVQMLKDSFEFQRTRYGGFWRCYQKYLYRSWLQRGEMLDTQRRQKHDKSCSE